MTKEIESQTAMELGNMEEVYEGMNVLSWRYALLYHTLS